MSDSTRDRILEQAEILLRKFGPEKLAVVDVARSLEMSHGNVYRHFASKASLFDAIVERWLHKVSDPLEHIVQEKQPAEVRLERWFLKMFRLKHDKVSRDPELFRMYTVLAEKCRDVVGEHVRTLRAQLTRLVEDGMAEGTFQEGDAAAAAGLLWNAMIRFHHPVFLSSEDAPPKESELRPLLAVLLRGISK